MTIARSRLIVVIALILTFSIAPSAIADKDENGISVLRQTGKAFTLVAKKAIPAVVSVKVEKSLPKGTQFNNRQAPLGDDLFEHFFGPRYRQPLPRKHKQLGEPSELMDLLISRRWKDRFAEFTREPV